LTNEVTPYHFKKRYIQRIVLPLLGRSLLGCPVTITPTSAEPPRTVHADNIGAETLGDIYLLSTREEMVVSASTYDTPTSVLVTALDSKSCPPFQALHN
jgi:hypothetical protein